MENPPVNQIHARFQRYANPVDYNIINGHLSYFDSMPVNYAIFKILHDAGYQHLESSGYGYIKSLPPVYNDFVFDRVYKGNGGVPTTDVTNLVQNESGSTLVAGVTLTTGDDLFFKLNQENGRFNRIYSILHTPGDANTTFTWW